MSFLAHGQLGPNSNARGSSINRRRGTRKFSPHGNGGVYIHMILHVYDTLRRKRRCVKIAFITVVLNSFFKN